MKDIIIDVPFGGIVSLSFIEILISLFFIIVLAFLVIQFFKKYREKFSNFNKLAIISLPLITISIGLAILSIWKWLLFIIILFLIFGYITIKFLEIGNVSKGLFYFLILYSSLFLWLSYLQRYPKIPHAGSSDIGGGILLFLMLFLFLTIILVWLFIKFFIIWKLNLQITKHTSSLKKSLKKMNFNKKFAISFTILISIFNLFISYCIYNCKDWGCLGCAMLGLLSLITVPVTGISALLGNEDILWIIALILSVILIPIYYFVGKFVGWLLSKFLDLFKRTEEHNKSYIN